MKRFIIKTVLSLYLSIAVMLWTAFILGGYSFDHVSHYGGDTPMALDTAICLFLLSLACASLSLRYISDMETWKAKCMIRKSGLMVE